MFGMLCSNFLNLLVGGDVKNFDKFETFLKDFDIDINVGVYHFSAPPRAHRYPGLAMPGMSRGEAKSNIFNVNRRFRSIVASNVKSVDFSDEMGSNLLKLFQ